MRALWVTAMVALAGACIPPPPDLCRRGVAQECERQFECQSADVKNSAGFIGGYGHTVDECKDRLAAQADCEHKLTENDLCIGADTGKTFDVGQAQQCEGARAAQSCADFLDPAKTPASCNARCK